MTLGIVSADRLADAQQMAADVGEIVMKGESSCICGIYDGARRLKIFERLPSTSTIIGTSRIITVPMGKLDWRISEVADAASARHQSADDGVREQLFILREG